jgi:hypothetical protein
MILERWFLWKNHGGLALQRKSAQSVVGKVKPRRTRLCLQINLVAKLRYLPQRVSLIRSLISFTFARMRRRFK